MNGNRSEIGPGMPAYQFGSGFLNGDGPSHLPPHSKFDLSIGKSFAKKLTYISPREVYGEVTYRFHFCPDCCVAPGQPLCDLRGSERRANRGREKRYTQCAE